MRRRFENTSGERDHPAVFSIRMQTASPIQYEASSFRLPVLLGLVRARAFQTDEQASPLAKGRGLIL
jgi:hypothetical protein